jgi:hypothetical protein
MSTISLPPAFFIAFFDSLPPLGANAFLPKLFCFSFGQYHCFLIRQRTNFNRPSLLWQVLWRSYDSDVAKVFT